MIPPIFRRPDPTIAALYGAIVTQARDPRFYDSYGAPDTVLGRFDLIVLHLALLLRRLRAGGTSAGTLAQGVFDAFCRDMDHNLREMGISDQGLPRHMRRVGEAFYGRAQAYEAALAASDDAALRGALARNVFAGTAADDAGGDTVVAALSTYVRQAAAALAAQPLEAFAQGAVKFPQPEPLPAAAE
jgi:cytochrome b pre-mRNA-processing protein 3